LLVNSCGLAGNLSFTVDSDTTRYIDLNDSTPHHGAKRGKTSRHRINSIATRAYVCEFRLANVSVWTSNK